jgi:lipopolysaccharide biosynthesis glycosyltransferase
LPSYGAVALGESLKLVGSKLKRVVMVTPEIGEDERSLLRLHWEIQEVEPIPCHHKYKSQPQDPTQYPQGLQQDMMRWKHTCTKFAAWKFTEYDRIIFMDSDTIVLNPIDDAFQYSNASLVAAPECFPPDTFNSGFLVLTPSLETFSHLISVGSDKGSAEGGDQGILNNYYCPNWFFVNDNDPLCGRLPWSYNVEAQYYETYKSYRKLYDQEPMKVIHYINDGKPWKTLMYDYNIDKIARTEMIEALASPSYVASHMYWRYCFLRATGMPRPERSIYYERWEDVVEKKGVYRLLVEPFYDPEKIEEEIVEKAAEDDNIRAQKVSDPAPQKNRREIEETRDEKRISTKKKKRKAEEEIHENERRRRERRVTQERAPTKTKKERRKRRRKAL